MKPRRRRILSPAMSFLLFGIAVRLVVSGCYSIGSIQGSLEVEPGAVFDVSFTVSPEYGSTTPKTPWMAVGLPAGFEIIPPVTYSGDYAGTGALTTVWADLESAFDVTPGLTWYGLEGGSHAPVEAGKTSTVHFKLKASTQPGVYYARYILGAPPGPSAFSDTPAQLPRMVVTAQRGGGFSPNHLQPTNAQPGQQLQLIVTLYNVGKAGDDRFTLAGDWGATFSVGAEPFTSTPTLPYAGCMDMLVTLQVPNAPGRHQVTLRARSVADPSRVTTATVDVFVPSPTRQLALRMDNTLCDVDLEQGFASLGPRISAAGANGRIAYQPGGKWACATVTEEDKVVMVQPSGTLTASLTVGDGPIDVAFAAAGRYAATLKYNFLGDPPSFGVTVIDTASRRVIGQLALPMSGVTAPRIVGHPTRPVAYVTTGDAKKLYAIDLGPSPAARTLFTTYPVVAPAVSPDGQRLYAVASTPTPMLLVFDARNDELLFAAGMPTDQLPGAIAVSGDSGLLLIPALERRTLEMQDARTMASAGSVQRGHPTTVCALEASPAGQPPRAYLSGGGTASGSSTCGRAAWWTTSRFRVVPLATWRCSIRTGRCLCPVCSAAAYASPA